MIIYQITRTLARGEVEAVSLPLQRLLEELLEAGGQAAQVQLLAPAHQLQHLIPQLLVGALPLCTRVNIHLVYLRLNTGDWHQMKAKKRMVVCARFFGIQWS